MDESGRGGPCLPEPGPSPRRQSPPSRHGRRRCRGQDPAAAPAPLDKPGRLHAQTARFCANEPVRAGGRARRRHRPDRCRQVQHPAADRRAALPPWSRHIKLAGTNPAALEDHRRRALREFVLQILALFRRNRPRQMDRSWSRASPRRCRAGAAGSPFRRPSKRPGGTGNATPTRRTDLEEKLSRWTSPHVDGAISSACVMA